MDRLKNEQDFSQQEGESQFGINIYNIFLSR
jgi:hypothetical protein